MTAWLARGHDDDPPGGVEILFMLVFPLLPLLIVIYVAVLLRDSAPEFAASTLARVRSNSG